MAIIDLFKNFIACKMNYIMHKILCLFILIFFANSSIHAQGNSIDFQSGSWTEILAKAKTENKLVFIDAYTTWCAPCKKMAKEVFPKTEVADFYNKMFVNIKMDMENGEGVNLARTYNVNVFPTLLFVDGEGSLVHRSAGYHNVEQFLTLGTEALDPSMQIASLKNRFEEVERILSYSRSRGLLGFPRGLEHRRQPQISL